MLHHVIRLHLLINCQLFLHVGKIYSWVSFSSAVFTAVVMVFMLYYTIADSVQQKKILTSGIGFLIVTAVTGIAYVCFQMQEGYNPLKTKWLLHIHVFASLYGSNLCGKTLT